MSANRRVNRTIRVALKQLFPFEPQGNFARHLNTLAALVAGMVPGKSSQLCNGQKDSSQLKPKESKIRKHG